MGPFARHHDLSREESIRDRIARGSCGLAETRKDLPVLGSWHKDPATGLRTERIYEPSACSKGLGDLKIFG